MSLVALQDVTVRQGGAVVLSHVDLAIDAGEIVTIVGPNGSGKSTLLRTVSGAIHPANGKVVTKPGLRIGYVPQVLHIDATLPLTVARFMSLPERLSRARIEAALKDADVAHLADRQMNALSGGQRQRVLLARALSREADLLLLDEATQGLDQAGAAAFYARIAEVRATRGCAVLMVSHELHVVMAASDRVICLNGHICCEGTPEVVAQAAEYRALFGTGTGGALALYRHEHDHTHDHDHDHHHPSDHDSAA